MAPTAGDSRETKNGNYVLAEDDGVQATAFEKDGEWGGIWKGAGDKARLLRAMCDSAGEAIDLMEKASREGAQSRRWWPRAETWTPKKDKKGFYRRTRSGAVVSIKQASSGGWFATHVERGILGRGGRPEWFPSADQVMLAVDAALEDPNTPWTWSNGGRQ